MPLFLFYFLCFFKIAFLSYFCIRFFFSFSYIVQVFFTFFPPFNWDKYNFFGFMCWFFRNLYYCLALNLLFSVWDWIECWGFSFSYKSVQMLITFFCWKNVCSTANNMSTIRSEFRHETETDSLWNPFGVCCVAMAVARLRNGNSNIAVCKAYM